jgi:hypothetical protein
MKVLTPTNQEYISLNGYKKERSELLFVKDGNNNFIVGLEVLNDINFLEIYDQLEQLQQIEYVPPIEPPFLAIK